jgi:hypothetical protein
MVEILHQFGHAFENGQGGAPGAPPTTIAGSGPGEDVELGDLMKVVLAIQREIHGLSVRLERSGR